MLDIRFNTAKCLHMFSSPEETNGPGRKRSLRQGQGRTQEPAPCLHLADIFRGQRVERAADSSANETHGSVITGGRRTLRGGRGELGSFRPQLQYHKQYV